MNFAEKLGAAAADGVRNLGEIFKEDAIVVAKKKMRQGEQRVVRSVGEAHML